MQSTLSRRPRQLIHSVFARILAWTHSSLTLRSLRGGNASLRSARGGSLASLGWASLRSAWLSSAGAYPIRVRCILAFVDNRDSQVIICVVPWSSLRSNYVIGALDDQTRQKSLWHISVCARCYICSVCSSWRLSYYIRGA